MERSKTRPSSTTTTRDSDVPHTLPIDQGGRTYTRPSSTAAVAESEGYQYPGYDETSAPAEVQRYLSSPTDFIDTDRGASTSEDFGPPPTSFRGATRPFLGGCRPWFRPAWQPSLRPAQPWAVGGPRHWRPPFMGGPTAPPPFRFGRGRGYRMPLAGRSSRSRGGWIQQTIGAPYGPLRSPRAFAGTFDVHRFSRPYGRHINTVTLPHTSSHRTQYDTVRSLEQRRHPFCQPHVRDSSNSSTIRSTPGNTRERQRSLQHETHPVRKQVSSGSGRTSGGSIRKRAHSSARYDLTVETSGKRRSMIRREDESRRRRRSESSTRRRSKSRTRRRSDSTRRRRSASGARVHASANAARHARGVMNASLVSGATRQDNGRRSETHTKSQRCTHRSRKGHKHSEAAKSHAPAHSKTDKHSCSSRLRVKGRHASRVNRIDSLSDAASKKVPVNKEPKDILCPTKVKAEISLATSKQVSLKEERKDIWTPTKLNAEVVLTPDSSLPLPVAAINEYCFRVSDHDIAQVREAGEHCLPYDGSLILEHAMLANGSGSQEYPPDSSILASVCFGDCRGVTSSLPSSCGPDACEDVKPGCENNGHDPTAPASTVDGGGTETQFISSCVPEAAGRTGSPEREIPLAQPLAPFFRPAETSPTVNQWLQVSFPGENGALSMHELCNEQQNVHAFDTIAETNGESRSAAVAPTAEELDFWERETVSMASTPSEGDDHDLIVLSEYFPVREGVFQQRSAACAAGSSVPVEVPMDCAAQNMQRSPVAGPSVLAMDSNAFGTPLDSLALAAYTALYILSYCGDKVSERRVHDLYALGRKNSHLVLGCGVQMLREARAAVRRNRAALHGSIRLFRSLAKLCWVTSEVVSCTDPEIENLRELVNDCPL